MGGGGGRTTGLRSGPDSGRRMQHPSRRTRSVDCANRGTEEREMNRMKVIAGLCAVAFLAAMPVVAQTEANKAEEPPKPALGPSAAIIEQWNDIGRKLIAMAEDFPEDKYDYRPNPDSRTLAKNLIHVSASMYYFTDLAQGNKPRYSDDPKRDELKTKAQVVAFVKKCVADGADLLKAKGDAALMTPINAGGPTMT